MKFMLDCLVNLIWLLPFSYLTGYSLVDWQWWLMCVAMTIYDIAHAELEKAFRPKMLTWRRFNG